MLIKKQNWIMDSYCAILGSLDLELTELFKVLHNKSAEIKIVEIDFDPVGDWDVNVYARMKVEDTEFGWYMRSRLIEENGNKSTTFETKVRSISKPKDVKLDDIWVALPLNVRLSRIRNVELLHFVYEAWIRVQGYLKSGTWQIHEIIETPENVPQVYRDLHVVNYEYSFNDVRTWEYMFSGTSMWPSDANDLQGTTGTTTMF